MVKAVLFLILVTINSSDFPGEPNGIGLSIQFVIVGMQGDIAVFSTILTFQKQNN